MQGNRRENHDDCTRYKYVNTLSEELVTPTGALDDRGVHTFAIRAIVVKVPQDDCVSK